MPDYRRIISYLYRYEDGEKAECAGFVKAEQKKHTFKLTLNIQGEERAEEKQLDLCFYQKKEEEWTAWMLDRFSPGEGQEENVFSYDRSSLPEGFDLERIYGVLLYDDDRLAYGSVWIGEEIPVTGLSRKTDQEAGTEIAEEAEINRNLAADQSEKVQTEPGEEAAEEPQTKPESEEKAAEPAEPEEEKNIAAEPAEPEEEKNIAAEPAEPEAEMNKAAEPEETEQARQASADPEGDVLEILKDQAPAAESIGNAAYYEGYQIDMSQLNLLGEEASHLAENPFLKKAYEKYQHLLACKVRYNGEDRFCIGVPGIYENREKYMAALYQFPIFLSASENRVKTGRFGYWLYLL